MYTVFSHRYALALEFSLERPRAFRHTSQFLYGVCMMIHLFHSPVSSTGCSSDVPWTELRSRCTLRYFSAPYQERRTHINQWAIISSVALHVVLWLSPAAPLHWCRTCPQRQLSNISVSFDPARPEQSEHIVDHFGSQA